MTIIVRFHGMYKMSRRYHNAEHDCIQVHKIFSKCEHSSVCVLHAFLVLENCSLEKSEI